MNIHRLLTSQAHQSALLISIAQVSLQNYERGALDIIQSSESEADGQLVLIDCCIMAV